MDSRSCSRSVRERTDRRDKTKSSSPQGRGEEFSEVKIKDRNVWKRSTRMRVSADESDKGPNEVKRVESVNYCFIKMISIFNYIQEN